ncbi:MAG: DegT/DnrJ/EryC1/StrS family aminotransferase [Bacteroidales bacterium]|jgi:dTDP-4-amino-4,6-dideoxygalactose transaminase|nr:DegT/DnrJ/EryC1/StrS family aminotransferase [Bacteroidales bacterium]
MEAINHNIEKILVTSPLIPDLKDFIPYLEQIWESKQLTNMGIFHEQLEKELCNYMRAANLTLTSNGTLALIIALRALRISGEVITTPYSFVATTHSLWWNNIKPVFVDIEPETLTIDPKKIEAAITPATTAILPVHVYGNPCKTEEIQQLADRYGLKVIYDAAHTFGAFLNGTPLTEYGDMSILSFHATKVFSTIEGGAVISHHQKTKEQLDYLKNFGYHDETTIINPGINAKLNELQAAYGLATLKMVDKAIAARKKVAETYRKALTDARGIGLLPEVPGLQSNYAYFPVLVDEKEYGMSRDELYFKLRNNNIFVRRYFYPLISKFPIYWGMSSASPENLPVAEKSASQILCLPIHQDLTEKNVSDVINLILDK